MVAMPEEYRKTKLQKILQISHFAFNASVLATVD
jgi:hypothetical protein